MKTETTPEDIKAAVQAAVELTVTIGRAVREVGEIPSGHLYAAVCGRLSLAQYEAIIDTLVGAGAVRRRGHLLVWAGK